MRWLEARSDDGVLAAWRAAVGAPVQVAPEAAPGAPPAVDRLAVVGWNVHAGHGNADALLAALRRDEPGAGGRPRHFALLLQEAVRVGDAVPESGGVGPASVGGPIDPARSIDALARRHGLFALYVPSMRNGAERREDRGNAILSTLPLRDPVAIELPFERQRRVAVAAEVTIATSRGPERIRLVSGHLDNGSGAARFWRSFGAGRLRQSEGLLRQIEEWQHVVLGADLNTWFGESSEPALRLLRRHLPAPARLPAEPTYSPPYALPERQVDYLLFRLPAGWEAGYRVAGERWGSDHSPLLGWIAAKADRRGPVGRSSTSAGPTTHDARAVTQLTAGSCRRVGSSAAEENVVARDDLIAIAAVVLALLVAVADLALLR